MESQTQNPEFRNNPENFYPCITIFVCAYYPFFCYERQLFLLMNLVMTQLSVYTKNIGSMEKMTPKDISNMKGRKAHELIQNSTLFMLFLNFQCATKCLQQMKFSNFMP